MRHSGPKSAPGLLGRVTGRFGRTFCLDRGHRRGRSGEPVRRSARAAQVAPRGALACQWHSGRAQCARAVVTNGGPGTRTGGTIACSAAGADPTLAVGTPGRRWGRRLGGGTRRALKAARRGETTGTVRTAASSGDESVTSPHSEADLPRLCTCSSLNGRPLRSGGICRDSVVPRTPTPSSAAAVPVDEYLTVAELALRLRLSPKSVRNRMYAGTWRRGEHWFSRPGISPRFRWSAIVRWLEGADAGDAAGQDAGLAYGPEIPRDRPRTSRTSRVDRARRAAV